MEDFHQTYLHVFKLGSAQCQYSLPPGGGERDYTLI